MDDAFLAAWRGLTDERRRALRAAAFSEDGVPDTLAGLVLEAVDAAERDELGRLLAELADGRRDFVELYARALEADVVLVRDRHHALPERLRGLPVYELAELAYMHRERLGSADVAAVHELRVAFPGSWIVDEPPPVELPELYGDEPPTVPCPVDGDRAWFRAGSGWTCATCHPPPRPHVPPAESAAP